MGGHAARKGHRDPNMHWAFKALYKYVLGRHQQEQIGMLPNPDSNATKYCTEILVDQTATSLDKTNQKWLSDVMRNLDHNPDEEGITASSWACWWPKSCSRKLFANTTRWFKTR